MWKLALNRIVQSRNIATTSLNCVVNSNKVFSESKYEKRQPGFNRERKPNYFERRGTSGGDNYWKADENVKQSFQRKPQFRNDSSNEKRNYVMDDEEESWTEANSNWDRNVKQTYQKKPHFRNDENRERRSYNNEDESPEKNANLSPIGVPSKWKVGANFEMEATSLRNKVKRYSDFHKIVRPARKNYDQEDSADSNPVRGRKIDPGMRRQLRNFDGIEREKIVEGELIEEEVDAMKFDKLYDMNKEDQEATREQRKMQIVKQKYFKEPQENILSWSDKEHIRFLHNTDPDKWTLEVIAEQFKIDFHIAKKVATAKWLPDKPKTKENLVSEELHLVAPKSQPFEDEVVVKDKNSRKVMNWKELSTSMGIVEEPAVKMNSNVAGTNDSLVEENNRELVLDYLSGATSKWSSSESGSVELKLDTDTKNVYFYDNKHGYQHPVGKADENTDANADSPILKEGNLIRKGDSFYNEEGEFLYRVPGITK